MEKEKQVALFDLDGVLIDTESQYTEFWEQIGKTYFPDNKSFASEIKGQTLTTIYQRYFKDMQIQLVVKEELNRFEEKMSYAFIPGVEAFLKDLAHHQVKMAVVTSSDQTKMKQVYRTHPQLATYFDRVFTAEDFAKSKPDPDCYLLGADYFSAEKSQCVVFEDSLNGLKAGYAAGMQVVGLSTSLSEQIIQPYAKLIIPDFTNFGYESFCALLS